MRRNELRESDERIPERGIRGTYAKLIMPRKDEGFDSLHFVRLKGTAGFIVEDWEDEIQ